MTSFKCFSGSFLQVVSCSYPKGQSRSSYTHISYKVKKQSYMDKNRLNAPRLSTASDGGYIEMRGTEEETGREHYRLLSATSDGYVEVSAEARYRVGPITNQPQSKEAVQFQDNCTYNAIVIHQLGEREMGKWQGREVTNSTLYKKLQDRPVPTETSQTSGARGDIEDQREYKTVLPGNALCSVWQGKAEIAIRIINLTLGGVVFLMLLAAVSNGGRIYNTDVGLILSRELSPATLFVTIACWMIVLAFTGTIEVFLCVARVYIIKRAKCILVWDVVHSIIMCVLYIVCTFLMIALTVSWTTLDRVPGALTEVNGEVGLLATCAILVFAYAGSLMLKAGWIIAFIKQNWSKKMDEYIESQNN